MATTSEELNQLLDNIIHIPTEEVGMQRYLDVEPMDRQSRLMTAIIVGRLNTLDIIGMLAIAVDRLTLMDIGQRMES